MAGSELAGMFRAQSHTLLRVQNAGTIPLMMCCAKNRFAQFLHSGQSFCWCAVQKTASLNFCTPDNLFVESTVSELSTKSLSGRSAKIKRVQRAVFCKSFQLDIMMCCAKNRFA